MNIKGELLCQGLLLKGPGAGAWTNATILYVPPTDAVPHSQAFEAQFPGGLAPSLLQPVASSMNAAGAVIGVDDNFYAADGSLNPLFGHLALYVPVEIKIMKPDADWWGDMLPEEQVILFNEKLRFRIQVPMYFESAQQMIDFMALSPLKFTTLGADGQTATYPISAANTEFASSQEGNWSHLRVLITWQQLQQI